MDHRRCRKWSVRHVNRGLHGNEQIAVQCRSPIPHGGNPNVQLQAICCLRTVFRGSAVCCRSFSRPVAIRRHLAHEFVADQVQPQTPNLLYQRGLVSLRQLQPRFLTSRPTVRIIPSPGSPMTPSASPSSTRTPFQSSPRKAAASISNRPEPSQPMAKRSL